MGANNSTTDPKIKHQVRAGDKIHKRCCKRTRLETDLKLEGVDKDTVRLVADGNIYRTTAGATKENQAAFDIKRCYFRNSTDNTYLVVQIGPYGYCDGCLLMKDVSPMILYRIKCRPAILNPKHSGNKSKHQLSITPPITSKVRIESEVTPQGAPTGKLQWKGEALIPTGYFPLDTEQYCVETIRNTHLNNSTIPDPDQFDDIERLFAKETVQVLTGVSSNKYSQVWSEHLPSPLIDQGQILDMEALTN